MELLKTPTLQHFSTLCGNSHADTDRRFKERNQKPAGISYERMRTAFLPDMFQLGVDTQTVKQAINAFPSERNRNANLGVLECLDQYRSLHEFGNVTPIDKRFFALNPNVLVPVNPPFVVIRDGAPVVFWPSFWKTPGKLSGMPGSVFGTILERELFARPDFRKLDLEFLDLSSPSGKGSRSFRVYRRNDFKILSQPELKDVLDYVVELIIAEKKAKLKKSADERTSPSMESGYGPLFD